MNMPIGTTRFEWEARPTLDPGSGKPDGGWMVSTPPAAVRIKCIQEGRQFTSVRIAVFDPNHYMPASECKANAMLLAAAKELFLACKNVTTAIPSKEGCDPSFWEIVEQCRDAVAKAESVVE
jgi:hypothetical protein